MEQSLWKILYGAWIVFELLLIVATRTRKSKGGVHDRGSIFLLWVVIFGSITAGDWYGYTHPRSLFAGVD